MAWSVEVRDERKRDWTIEGNHRWLAVLPDFLQLPRQKRLLVCPQGLGVYTAMRHIILMIVIFSVFALSACNKKAAPPTIHASSVTSASNFGSSVTITSSAAADGDAIVCVVEIADDSAKVTPPKGWEGDGKVFGNIFTTGSISPSFVIFNTSKATWQVANCATFPKPYGSRWSSFEWRKK